VLEAFHRLLKRREAFALASQRWADPRAQLLAGAAWEQARIATFGAVSGWPRCSPRATAIGLEEERESAAPLCSIHPYFQMSSAWPSPALFAAVTTERSRGRIDARPCKSSGSFVAAAPFAHYRQRPRSGMIAMMPGYG